MISRITRISLLTSLIIFLTASLSVNASSKPHKQLKDRVSLPARLAPSYSIPDLQGETVYNSSDQPEARKIALNSPRSRSNPDIVGYTTYDYQHNCTMARQIEHRGTNFVHFDWMAQNHDSLGYNRGIGYQVYQQDVCDYVFISGGLRIETDYAGYVGLDTDPGGWAVVGAHQKVESVYYPMAFWDFAPGGPAFGLFNSDYSLDNYGWTVNSGTGPGNENIWPKIDWHIGTETVLHMVATERGGANGNPKSISYYRRVGPYGLDQGVWSDQRVIDTVMNMNPTVVSSPVSDRVAIVWNAPVDYRRDTPNEFDNQYENDIWYAVSTDQGTDWAYLDDDDTISTNEGDPSIGHLVDIGIYDGDNITTYDPLNDYKAYCDISALITTGDELNIVWGCRRWTDTTSLFRRQSAIFHWAENMPSRILPVVKANWDTGGACYAHAWGSDAAKMSISECDGKLYTLYTQFGSSEYPCDDIDEINSVVNGYLYLSAFDPGVGPAWDRPKRVTSLPETEGCTPGDMSGPGTCNSEYWASMARYGRVDECENPGLNVLDIVYINDYAPGGCVQTESGVWTVNPVMWTTTLCREVSIAPILNYWPKQVGLCYDEPIFIIKPDFDTSFTVTLENAGMVDVNFTAEVMIDSCNNPIGGNNTTVEIDPEAGVVLKYGGETELTVSVTTLDEMMNITIYAHIRIDHDAEGYPPIIIPICMNVANIDWPWNSYYTMETTCKKLRVYNNGEISNNAVNESMDYIDDPDDCANIYLYDGSPIICRESDGEKRCFFTVYENDYNSDHALRQTSDVYIDNTTSTDYTRAWTHFVTADTAIGMCVDYFAPTHPDFCEFIIQRISFWNLTEETLTDVAVGEWLDWDIPSYDATHSVSDNESDFDATRNLIYQVSCWNDDCDTTVESNRIGGIASAAYYGFKNYMTIENDVYVYSNGPYGSDAPVPDEPIYDLMTGVDGFDRAYIDSCEDLSTLITFDVYNLDPGDTIKVMAVLVTSRNDPGGANLRDEAQMAIAFIMEYPEIYWYPISFPIPADANYDGIINVGDAVYIIAYVFNGGAPPEPFPVYCGDSNGDCQCNVGDAVHLINYIFKDGQEPPTRGEWIDLCGLPIR